MAESTRTVRSPATIAIPTLWLLALSALLTACGVPTTSSPIVVSAVPYDLMSPAETGDARSTTVSRRGPRVYLLDDQDRLVAVTVDETQGGAAQQVTALLGVLQAGPSADERSRGLSSALGPDVALRLHSLVSGRLAIAIETGASAPPAGRAPRAVAQIVLSASTVPGVDSVVFLQSGQPIAVPLPDGALVDRPVIAADYRSLLGTSP